MTLWTRERKQQAITKNWRRIGVGVASFVVGLLLNVATRAVPNGGWVLAFGLISSVLLIIGIVVFLVGVVRLLTSLTHQIRE